MSVYLPPGKTEAEVMAAIENAVAILSPKYVFGYYALDDVQQEARIMGLECLPRYEPTKPLANFVFSHIRNRLCNLIRNKLRRNDPPCKQCHTGLPCKPDGMLCDKYAGWVERNLAKSGLVQPHDISNVAEQFQMDEEAPPEEQAAVKELLEKIDRELPVELRSTYLRMRAGVPVLYPKKKDEVMRWLREILASSTEGED